MYKDMISDKNFSPKIIKYLFLSYSPHAVGLASLLGVIGVYIDNHATSSLREEMDNAFLLSILASYFFYIYSVAWPARTRRKIIKSNFSFQVSEFKRTNITRFLGILKIKTDTELLVFLEQPKNFRAFFKEQYEPGQTRWDYIATIIGNDSGIRKAVLMDLEILKDESAFILNNIEITDIWVFSILKSLSVAIYNIQNEDEDENQIMSFFWQVFAGWSYVEGYDDTPFFDSFLKAI